MRYAQLSDEEKAELKRGYDDVLAGRVTNIPLAVFTPEGFDAIQKGQEDIDAGRTISLDDLKRKLGDAP